MCFEANHNYFKDLAHRTKHFKNIAILLSYRHYVVDFTQAINVKQTSWNMVSCFRSNVANRHVRPKTLISAGAKKLLYQFSTP